MISQDLCCRLANDELKASVVLQPGSHSAVTARSVALTVALILERLPVGPTLSTHFENFWVMAVLVSTGSTACLGVCC